MTLVFVTNRSSARQWTRSLARCWLVAFVAITFAHADEGAHEGEPTPTSTAAQLNALLERSDERSLRLNPLNALSRGDVNRAGFPGDSLL